MIMHTMCSPVYQCRFTLASEFGLMMKEKRNKINLATGKLVSFTTRKLLISQFKDLLNINLPK